MRDSSEGKNRTGCLIGLCSTFSVNGITTQVCSESGIKKSAKAWEKNMSSVYKIGLEIITIGGSIESSSGLLDFFFLLDFSQLK